VGRGEGDYGSRSTILPARVQIINSEMRRRSRVRRFFFMHLPATRRTDTPPTLPLPHFYFYPDGIVDFGSRSPFNIVARPFNSCLSISVDLSSSPRYLHRLTSQLTKLFSRVTSAFLRQLHFLSHSLYSPSLTKLLFRAGESHFIPTRYLLHFLKLTSFIALACICL
jgi:hypothetical protein